MYCANCGKELAGAPKFCVYCGSQQPAVPTEEDAPTSAEETVQPAEAESPSGLSEFLSSAGADELERVAEAYRSSAESGETAASAEYGAPPMPVPMPVPIADAGSSQPEPARSADVKPEPVKPEPAKSAPAKPALPDDVVVIKTDGGEPDKPERKYTFGHIIMCLAAAAVMAVTAGVFAGLYFATV